MDGQNVSITMRVGEQIRSARLAMKLSQAELGDLVSLSPQSISRIENGKRIMSIENYAKILSVLHLSSDFVLGLDVPTVRNTHQSDLDQVLLDCTPRESEAILKIVNEVKSVLHEQRDSE